MAHKTLARLRAPLQRSNTLCYSELPCNATEYRRMWQLDGAIWRSVPSTVLQTPFWLISQGWSQMGWRRSKMGEHKLLWPRSHKKTKCQGFSSKKVPTECGGIFDPKKKQMSTFFLKKKSPNWAWRDIQTEKRSAFSIIMSWMTRSLSCCHINQCHRKRTLFVNFRCFNKETLCSKMANYNVAIICTCASHIILTQWIFDRITDPVYKYGRCLILHCFYHSIFFAVNNYSFKTNKKNWIQIEISSVRISSNIASQVG